MELAPPVKLQWVIDSIKLTQKADYDIGILITGAKRRGKSALAHHLAHLIDPAFSMKEQTVYTFPQFERAVQNLPRRRVIWVDEAIEVFYKQNWNTRETKRAAQLLAQYGLRNHCYIYCMPRAGDLFGPLFRDEIRLWFHVFTRGQAVILRRLDNPLISDPWLLDRYAQQMEKWLYRRAHDGGEDVVKEAMLRHPTAWGFTSFPDFPQGWARLEYETAKMKGLEAAAKEGKGEGEEKDVSKQERRRERALAEVLRWALEHGGSWAELAKVTGWTDKGLRQITERKVGRPRKAMAQIKIEEERTPTL